VEEEFGRFLLWIRGDRVERTTRSLLKGNSCLGLADDVTARALYPLTISYPNYYHPFHRNCIARTVSNNRLCPLFLYKSGTSRIFGSRPRRSSNFVNLNSTYTTGFQFRAARTNASQKPKGYILGMLPYIFQALIAEENLQEQASR
jgi:hypothetical protein